MHPSAGNYPVMNWIIAYELIQIGLLTSVCASSLKLGGIVRGLMDDNCVLEFLNHTTYTCSMNPETAITMHLWSF